MFASNVLILTLKSNLGNILLRDCFVVMQLSVRRCQRSRELTRIVCRCMLDCCVQHSLHSCNVYIDDKCRQTFRNLSAGLLSIDRQFSVTGEWWAFVVIHAAEVGFAALFHPLCRCIYLGRLCLLYNRDGEKVYIFVDKQLLSSKKNHRTSATGKWSISANYDLTC